MLVFRCLRLVLTDVLSPSCLHHFLMEFLGTALFMTISLSAVLMLPEDRSADLRSAKTPANQSRLSGHAHVSPACPLQVVLVFGLSVAMATLCVGGAAHLNPAVSMVMALTLRLRLWRAALYVIGQLLGGVASAVLLLGLTGDLSPVLNQVSSGIQLHQAVTMETLVTLQLVLVVMATSDVPLPAIVSPLLVGLAVSLGHLVTVGATGCGMNPARSFGPAVVTLSFNNHWVFWLGPGLGACIAGLLNDVLLRPRWRCPRDWWAELKQLYVLAETQQPVALTHLP